MKKLVLLLTGILLTSSCISSVEIDGISDESLFIVYKIKSTGDEHRVRYGLTITNKIEKDGVRKYWVVGEKKLFTGDTLVFKKKNSFYDQFGDPYVIVSIEKGDGELNRYTMGKKDGFIFREIIFNSRIKYKTGDTLILQKK